jgi:ABC-2 type transport system permease protein
LKSLYRGSALGYVWTLAQPLLLLVVFTIVFDVALKVDIEDYPVFVFTGLLLWQAFSMALTRSTTSLVDNAPMVQNVWFPRDTLVVSTVAAQFVNYVLQLPVLVVSLVVFRHMPDPRFLPAAMLGVMALFVLAWALGTVTAAANVYLRDVRFVVEAVVLAWFWVSGVVFPLERLRESLGQFGWVVFLNPAAAPIMAVQRAVFGPAPGSLPKWGPLTYTLMSLGSFLASSAMLVVALWVFSRMEDNLGDAL